MHLPHLAFASPRLLPKADKVPGRVVVLDIAFAATVGASVSFELITQPFITGLGDRLAAWVDHHDHEKHAAFAGDPRFVLSTKNVVRGLGRGGWRCATGSAMSCCTTR